MKSTINNLDMGAFKTSPLYGIEALAGLISINLHL